MTPEDNGKTPEERFFVQIKCSDDNSLQDERGPFIERKAIKVANGMDINMSDDFYTEVVEHD